MKKIISIILILTIIFSVFSLNITSANAENIETSANFVDIFKANSTLAWNDEFDGDKLDESKWKISKAWGRNAETWGTQEDGNIVVSDGMLKLRAYEKAASEVTFGTPQTKMIQSAEINSQAAWSDGLVEIRAKLPKGKGVYPAIWTLGANYDPTDDDFTLWPWAGEIDIMEAVGTANTDENNCTTWQSLHTSKPYTTPGIDQNGAHIATGLGEYKTLSEVPLNDDFHNFWLYSDRSIMIVGVDEYMMSIKDLSDPNLVCFQGWEQWLILGLQMGALAGTPERTDYSVWEMLVDYVRVYRLDDIKDYSKYQIFEAENLEFKGMAASSYMPCPQRCVVNPSSSDTTLYLKDIKAGNYDVIIDYVGTSQSSIYDTYINGVKTGEIDALADYKGHMKYTKIGNVTLEEDCSFQLNFDYKSGSSLYIDKVFLIKTDATSDILINKENEITTSDYIEVSTEDEFVNAFHLLSDNGTIKLINDITLSKRVYTFNEPVIDLNGKTLNITTGCFSISDENKLNLFKNGNVVILDRNFISTRENNYNAKVELDNVNVTVNSTASSGYVFNHNYGNINIAANNCEFTFGENVSSTSSFLISRNTGIYNNCTFNLNGKKAFLVSNGSNNSTRQLHFNNCTINDALYLFHSEKTLTQYVKVTKDGETYVNYAKYYDYNVTNNTRSLAYISLILQGDEDAYSVLSDENKALVDVWAAKHGEVTYEYFNYSTTNYNGNTMSDTGVIMLPKNYSEEGKPVRLVIDCHGYSATINSSENFYNKYNWCKTLVHDGYAVLAAVENPYHMGTPFAVESYINAYKYAIENYNVYEEVYVNGNSMGGITSINLVCSEKIPVIAHSLQYPATSIVHQLNYNEWAEGTRKSLSTFYGFDFPTDENGTEYTADTFPFTSDIRTFGSDAELELFEDNFFDKIVPTYSYYRFTNILNESKTGFAEGFEDFISCNTQERVDELYNNMTIDYPVPVFVQQCLDDGSVRTHMTKLFENSVKNGSNNITSIYYNGSKHGGDIGNDVTYLAKDNTTLSVRESSVEMSKFITDIENTITDKK